MRHAGNLHNTGRSTEQVPPAAMAEQESEISIGHRQLDDQKAAIGLANIIRPLWARSGCSLDGETVIGLRQRLKGR